jgi:hypothetical protein
LIDMESPTPEQKRAALDAVLQSETFARSDQLRNFLHYIGEMTLSGRGREISEYLIAVEALGRPADFSPADDSSVRSRAHELRRKILKYYESENREASILIDLPKGSYVLRFGPRDEKESQVDIDEAQAARRPGSRLILAALAVFMVSTALLSWLLVRERALNHPDMALAEAWGPLAGSNSNALVCIATTLHLVVRPYMSVVAEGLPKYSAPPELYPLFRQHRPLPADVKLDMHPVDNSVQMGHLAGVVVLANSLRALGATFQILPERSAPVTAMRGRNVILIGDPQNSEAASRFLEKTPLTIDFDPAVQDLVVRDRRSGRSYIPERGADKRFTDAYGLITVLPSTGATENQRTVIISGITSVGSNGAAEFFASARNLRDLKRRFQQEGLAGFPSAYQVVVRCKSNDTLLLSSDYETHVTWQK